MKLIQESEHIFIKYFLPKMQEDFSDVLEKACIGLVGEGSECFGFDDEISRDHDSGVGFCIWLDNADYHLHKERLEKFLLNSPAEFNGLPNKFHNPNLWGKRIGVLSAQNFYAQFLGKPQIPGSWQEWISVPEYFFAVCTNGKLFWEKECLFASMRKQLLSCYPYEVWLKKMSASCYTIAQAGQYNAVRAIKRNDYGTLTLCLAEFCNAIISLLFLLNKQYAPFYKWKYTALKQLPLLGDEAYYALLAINQSSSSEQSYPDCIQYMENLCERIRVIFNEQGLSSIKDNWFMLHAEELQKKIKTIPLKQYSLLQV